MTARDYSESAYFSHPEKRNAHYIVPLANPPWAVSLPFIKHVTLLSPSIERGTTCLDISADLPLSSGSEGVASFGEDFHEVVGQISTR